MVPKVLTYLIKLNEKALNTNYLNSQKETSIKYKIMFKSHNSRTLSFWRALTAECIATFLYSLLVSLMAASSQDTEPATTQAFTGVVAGLAIATLSTIFLPVRKQNPHHF